MNANNTLIVTGETLDKYLADGWYRMGQHIFTTDKIFYEEAYYNVYWLRYNLSKFKYTNKHKKLLQNAKDFQFEITNHIFTEELATLYEKYYHQTNFDASATLQNVLLSCEPNPEITRVEFNSIAITVQLEENTIAAGIMDIGKNTIAGILNFYHPSFKKYSLGKVLVLKKMEFAILQNMQYYYPGYIVPGVDKFNYKTFVGKDCIEVWDAETKNWVGYKEFFKEN
jgi:arginine-tRNA-protein transferase